MSVNLLFNQLPQTPSTSTASYGSQFSNNCNLTYPSTSSISLTSGIDSSNATSILVAAATKAATTALLQRGNISEDERKLDELLLPALIGHEALPIHLKLLYDNILPTLSSNMVKTTIEKSGWSMEDFEKGYIKNISSLLAPSPQNFQHQQLIEPRTTWRCANLPTTLQVLNSARDNYPTFTSNIDTLRQSLTQTIYVALINASSPSNGIEMPTIASLAPNNTSLHINREPKSDNMTENEQQLLGLSSIPSQPPQVVSLESSSPGSLGSQELRRDSYPLTASSPAKSELSIMTDISSSDIRSEMGSLSLKSEKPGKSLKNIKKRVVCGKCTKSFCDKGALKIHNSSVHLREMHICTVPGCMKQFPSKRSRNRHSNNPNMHTDAGRRRNCRTTTTAQNASTPPSHSQPQQQQPPSSTHQDHPQASHNILSILHRLVTSHSQHPQPPLQPAVSNPEPFPLPIPQLPLPPQNPEISGLIKFMISQRQKSTLC